MEREVHVPPTYTCPGCKHECWALNFDIRGVNHCETCFVEENRRNSSLFTCGFCNKKTAQVAIQDNVRYCIPCYYYRKLEIDRPSNIAEKMAWKSYAYSRPVKDDLVLVQRAISEAAMKGQFVAKWKQNMSEITAEWLRKEGFTMSSDGTYIRIFWFK